MPERIYLTGFMGCGKSTIGAILSNVLGYRYLDLDAEIESKINMTIPSFFSQFGEAAFRAVETRVLAQTFGLHKVIIGLGGGALAQPENLRQTLRHGLVVYLVLSAEELTDRLRYSTNRPLLLDENGKTVSPSVLFERISGIMAVRKPFYEQAHIQVNLSRQTVGESVDAVAKAIYQYRKDRKKNRV